jgi:putative ABC transport system permease protein
MHKRRLFGTAFAVVLGVAFLTATLVLGASTRSGITELFTDGNAGTDVVVRSATRFPSDSGDLAAPLDAGVVDAVRTVPGVTAAQPDVEGVATILGTDGRPVGGNGPPTIGGNWIDDPTVSAWRIVQGHAPTAAGEVVIDQRTADDGHLTVGSATTVLAPDPVPVTVVGVMALGDHDSLGGVNFTAFTTDQAAELFAGGAGHVTSVLVVGDGRPEEQLAEAIRPVLPAGVESLTGDQLVAEQTHDVEADFVDFLETFMLVFAGIALLAATFSIYNTFSILVAQRSREHALLRAVGASRKQVLGTTVLEALLVGSVASLAGVAGGFGLVSLLRTLMSGSDFELPQGHVAITHPRVVVALVTGVVVTLLASLSPAVKASRVPPIAAMRDVALDRSGGSRIRFLLGLVLAGGGAALTVTAVQGSGGIGVAGLGALTILAGLVALGPVVARPAAAVIGTPMALRGLSGRLARRNAMRSPRRTAGAASSLLVGVGVVTLFTGFAASIKASMSDTLDRSYRGDLVVEPRSFSGAQLSPAVAGRVAQVPGVDATAALGEGTARIDGHEEDLLVVDPTAYQRLVDLDTRAGAFADGATGLAVSKKLADDRHWTVGDVVPVTYPDGAQQDLPVAMVYGDRTITGDVMIPTALWAPHVTQRSDMVVLIDAAPGTDLTTLKGSLAQLTQPYGEPKLQDRQEFLDDQAAQIDQSLGIVYALLAMAIIIAVLSIANTISLSIHERTRELGLLRAVGQQRRQLRSMVRGEAVIVSLFGTIGGIGIGTFLSWALVRVVADSEGFGTWKVPTAQFAVILGLGALAGVLAAARPARRAAKLPVLTAVAS